MPLISSSFIEDLKTRVNIVEVINSRVLLKKAGRNYKACCPFHEEKTPSFTVHEAKQMYHCFGCSAGGGVLEFIRQYEHLDFVEAVVLLAKEVGVDVVYERNHQKQDIYTKNTHYKNMMAKLCHYYQQQLRTHPLKEKLITYLKSRGISGSIAKRFELGFAPFDKALKSVFKDDIESLVTLGMLGETETKSDYYVRFRDRLIFPIHSDRGDVVGFGGRALLEENMPKYLNSPETPIFTKGAELYGLYHCRKYTRRIDFILVVEGYMDVVSLHEHGITSVVATLGTATSATHLEKLLRVSKNIIFSFDGDAAGKKAAWRALEEALPVIKPGVNIKFLFLPKNEDPDSFVRKKGKETFLIKLADAMALSEYLLSHLQAQVNFSSIEGKTAFLESAFTQISKIYYPLYQEELLLKLSEISSHDIAQIKKIFQAKNEQVHRTAQMRKKSQLTDNTARTSKQKKVRTDKQKNILLPAMADAIALVLHYPNIACVLSESKLAEIAQFDNRRILLGIIDNIRKNASTEKAQSLKMNALIAPFKSDAIFSKLENLAEQAPLIDNEKEGELAFFERMDTLYKNYLKSKIDTLMQKENKTPDEEQYLPRLIANLQHKKNL